MQGNGDDDDDARKNAVRCGKIYHRTRGCDRIPNDALESGHAPYIAAVLGDVARSEGMTKLAEKTGVNRQALYTALSENGNPTLETLLKVMSALGIRLKCEASEQAKAA
jgi:probable addiction module antidote protein